MAIDIELTIIRINVRWLIDDGFLEYNGGWKIQEHRRSCLIGWDGFRLFECINYFGREAWTFDLLGTFGMKFGCEDTLSP